MIIQRRVALTAAAVVATAGLGLSATSASASDLDCYEVGFERSPSAGVVLAPPNVKVDDGDPYVRRSEGSCTP